MRHSNANFYTFATCCIQILFNQKLVVASKTKPVSYGIVQMQIFGMTLRLSVFTCD